MALDDQTMNLRVTVDSSQVAPGMDAAATQVAAGAAKMQTTVASSLRAQGRSVDEVQQIYKQLGFTGAQAAQEINAAFGASMEEVAAKSEEVAARGHVAFGRMTGEITTARFAASGLSQELGLGMPRALTTFLARSETIGPILSKAFSVVAAVALAEIIAKLPDMIQSATDALEGFDDEAKKAFGDAVEADIRLVTQLAHHKDAMAEVGTIGTAGMGRIGAESAAAKIHVQDAAAAATELTRRLINAKAELAALRAPTLTNVFTRSAEDLTQAQSKVNDLQKALDELQPFLRFGQFEEGARLSREAAAQMAEDFQKLDLSRASLSAELAHEEYTLHQTTLDQETKALEDAET
ncbi:MAG TPA: hypothetical protein VJV74_04210, partial [Terriglobia bacterium]|nr:hypothetical protein [Terriglobia bacterium]